MQGTQRFPITLLFLAITFAACACGESSDDPMAMPSADAGPTPELIAARAACMTACDALERATDCAFDLAQLAEQCRANCDNELESGGWECAPQLEDYFVCMAGAEWTCRGGQNPIPTPPGLCDAETTAFNECLRSRP